MEIQDESNGRKYRVMLELPFDVRAFGWAIWHIVLGFCLGVAVYNLAVVLGGLH
jgi:hypothetical protein